ncbi:MAG: MSHA type pilus biogenesis protein MshL [Desulforhopalus sp.]|jgi:MSHA type pilus biogenesis protein MshL
MKYLKYCFVCSSLLLLSLLFSSCATDTPEKEQISSQTQETVQPVNSPATMSVHVSPASLPVRYQTGSYVVDKDEADDVLISEESKLKVGAKITSMRGPQPLVDILKRLASLKNMTVSWASDVDKNVLVDVNIGANDDFYDAIDNMLRQVDYYHEMQSSTIIVKYKETRQFHIAMPFIKQAYKTNTGGDVLGGTSGEGSTTNVAGEISLMTDGAAINKTNDGKLGGIEFNTWNSIENNLNAILNIWTTDEVKSIATADSDQTDYNHKDNPNRTDLDFQTDTNRDKQVAEATFRKSSGGNSYFIDKPVGLITVTAPRPLIDKLDVYFKSLKKELYKQISIEAKIIEVQLDDHSSIGLNWNTIFENLSIGAGLASGSRTYDNIKTNNTSNSTTNTTSNGRSNTTTDGISSDIGTNITNNIGESITSAATVLTNGFSSGYAGAVSLAAFTFDSFLNAVSEQGQTNILSNPKLSVLNGQPALMTVGRNVTYIDNISSETGAGANPITTYTVETARALSGVGLALTANILDDNQIILNLVPVTSELVEPIEYREVGLGEVGLPIINVREISTTVKVRDGDMLVIGGLISSVEASDGSFIPGTSGIPFFKYLFGYEEKTTRKRELIILLQPRII